MKLLWGGSAVLTVLLSLLGFQSRTEPLLVVREAATDRTVVCQPAPSGTPVVLTFQHSMYGGDVREEYRATGLSLRRTRITTANAAAAEYYAYLGGVAGDGERFRIEAPEATLDELSVLVDDVGRQRLLVGTTDYDLLALAGEGVSVRVGLDTGRGLLPRWLRHC